MKLVRIIPLVAIAALLATIALWQGAKQPAKSHSQPSTSAARKAAPSSETAAAAPVPALAPVAQPDLPKTQLLRSIVTAIEGVHSTTDALEKDARLKGAVSGVATNEFKEVVNYLWHKQHLSPAGVELRDRLLQRWAETDPKAAAEYIGQQPAGDIQSAAIERVASVWANLDFDAAVDWAKKLPEANLQHESLAQIAYEAARTSPLEAMKLAVELPAGPTRDDVLSHLAGTWIAEDPKAALSWIGDVKDVALRERMFAGALATYGEQNPMEAAQLALSSLSAGRQQDDTVVSIVKGWVQSSPTEAAAWVGQFPEGQLRETAVENVVEGWFDQDMKAAAEWVHGMAAGPVRDVGIGAMVSKILSQSPQSASEWAVTITDPVRRQREMENVGASWMESDAAAAKNWINGSSLPAPVKERLLNPPAPQISNVEIPQ